MEHRILILGLFLLGGYEAASLLEKDDDGSKQLNVHELDPQKSESLVMTQMMAGNDSDKCRLPMQMGPCADEFQKWYYDNTFNECRAFTYSGCDGNENRFDSEEACRGECGAPVPPVPQAPVIEKCQQPMQVGPCANKFQKWYYDNTFFKRCRMFFYGGCEGNENRFDSQEACRSECGAPAPPVPQAPVTEKCQQPLDPGPCSSAYPMWYYDNSYNECRAFTYGGCDGNENRFDSEEACRGECGAPAPPVPQAPVIDKCQQRMETVSCQEEVPMWYYDTNLNICLITYGECQGNENRFDSEAACSECIRPINETDPSNADHQNRELAAMDETPNMQNNKGCKQRDDEFETFGQYVVSSLHNINERAAINAQNEIQYTLTKYKLRDLKKSSI